MLNKFVKIIIFLLYSWCIYQSYLLIVTILVLFAHNFEITALRIDKFCDYFFFPILLAHQIIEELSENILRIHLIIFSGLYAILFIPWYQKQSILRAWYVALIGFLIGPGFGFWGKTMTFGDGGQNQPYGFPTFIILNLFYLLLYIVNFLQTHFYPDNKLANRIRFILKWPCLRT